MLKNRTTNVKKMTCLGLSSFAAILLLSGCLGDFVETNVLQESPVGKTIYVQSFKEQNTDNMQWTKVVQILNQELTNKGLSITSNRSKADFIGYFGYAIDNGEKVISSYSVPNWGVTGYSGSSTYGSTYGNSFSATTSYTPSYGVTGYSSGLTSSIVYTRSVKFDIYDAKTRKVIFDGKGISRGSCHVIVSVAPQIIASILKDFPNETAKKVSLPWPGNC
jgi:hypothetical protein